jgi:hypothetical protein
MRMHKITGDHAKCATQRSSVAEGSPASGVSKPNGTTRDSQPFNGVGHNVNATQNSLADTNREGGASPNAQPKPPPPHSPTLNGDHTYNEARKDIVAEGSPATARSKSKKRTQDSRLFNGVGHCCIATQVAHADTGMEGGASLDLKPIGVTPHSPHALTGDQIRHVTQIPHVAEGSPARILTKPNCDSRDSQLLNGVGHCDRATQSKDADTDGSHGHARLATQGNDAVAPTPLNGDHLSGVTQARNVAAVGGSHVSIATHNGYAVPDTSLNGDQGRYATHTTRVAAVEIDHPDLATQSANVDLDIIIAQWRLRQSWHRAEKSLTLQCSAICRRYVSGDKVKAGKLLAKIEKGEGDPVAALAVAPLLAARAQIEPMRKGVEKTLVKLVKHHPMAPFIKETRGVALLSLAALIGEAGDIGSFKSVAALWKRFGLAVIRGERQRRVSGIDALEHGYSPPRRSVMYLIGGGLVGAMGNGPRPRVGEDVSGRNDLTEWQKLFIERIRYEADRDPEAHRREPVEDKDGVMRESFSRHAAARARRYVEKRFLATLFGKWRGHPPCAIDGRKHYAPH